MKFSCRDQNSLGKMYVAVSNGATKSYQTKMRCPQIYTIEILCVGFFIQIIYDLFAFIFFFSFIHLARFVKAMRLCTLHSDIDTYIIDGFHSVLIFICTRWLLCKRYNTCLWLGDTRCGSRATFYALVYNSKIIWTVNRICAIVLLRVCFSSWHCWAYRKRKEENEINNSFLLNMLSFFYYHIRRTHTHTHSLIQIN